MTMARTTRTVLASALTALAAFCMLAQPLDEAYASTRSSPDLSAARVKPRIHDEALARFFDGYMTDAISRLDLPGGAIVVVRNGRTLLAKGYGVANLDSRRPISLEDSIFRLASVSKIATWLTVMQLVEEGRLDLDRDVNDYLDFRIPRSFGRAITMRHLMTHSAGFAERFWGAYQPDTPASLEEVLRNNVPARVYAPGSTVAYSNYGAGLAGHIVERLRGQPFERVVAERVFAPAGMRRSTFAQVVPQALRPLLVSNYTPGSRRPSVFRTLEVAPAGSMSSSPADMGRFLLMLQNGGRGANGQIVASDTLGRMFTLAKPLGPRLPAGLGLGFLAGEHRGVRYAGHAGNLTSVATDLEILPDAGIGWYYVFNGQGTNEGARAIRTELLNAVIDRLDASARPAARPRGPSSAADLAGSYVTTRRQRSGPLLMSPLMDTTEVYPEKDGNITIVASGKATHWLPDGPDRFTEEKSGAALSATRGKDGRVSRIASPIFHPAAEFERAPGFVRWVEDVTKASLFTLFIGVVAAPISWALRRRHMRALAAAGAANAEGPTQPHALRLTRKAARISFWLIVATLLAWGAFAARLAFDMGFLFTAPAPVRVSLGVASMLSAPFAAILSADAVLAWRDPQRGLPSRIFALALAAAAIGLAWLFYVFDVTNFSTDW